MIKNTKTRQKGFYISDLSANVLWTVLLIFSFVLFILFTYTLINVYKEHNIQSTLQENSSIISKQINLNFMAINDQVNNAIESGLKESSQDDLVSYIKAKLPTAIRVLYIDQNLDNIQPKDFPGINYATLFMLKSANKLNVDPIAEIHLFGQKNQYLNYTYILNESKSFIIISMPTLAVFDNLKSPQLEEGGIVLEQNAGKYSLVRLKTWGDFVNNSNIVIKTFKIPNSYFTVKYSYTPPFYLLRGMTTLSAFIGMLSSILLFIAVILTILKAKKLANRKKQKNKPYVHLSAEHKPQTIEETLQLSHKKENMHNIELDKTIFRAYDIRGIVDESLTVEAVKLIGQAIGTENINRGKTDIVIARDGRLSGESLLKALSEGLIKSGCNVINIGAVPTGVLYFATHHLETGSGVMLTGSHNPANYNGLKIMLDGETLAGKLIMDLYKSIVNNNLVEGEGSEQEMDIVDDYVDYISSDIQLESELKIVVDCGNGIGGDVGPQILEEIGCEVIRLHCEIDGNFPNHHPDPSVPENLEDLIAAVQTEDADIGIAFDGDADRLGVVTKDGKIIYPDRLLMLFAQDVLTRQPGASIIFDVKCTGHLPKEIVKHGGLPIIWKTGHSFMKAKIKETQAALAGEMSGHFFFNERWFGFDDGIYAAARLLEILDNENRPAIEIFEELPNSISTPELKCHTEEGENYAFMEKFQKVAEFPDAHITSIDGIRADFANGWGLIRCSNTTPCLVLRFDANTQEDLDKIKEEFRDQILAVDSSLKLPF